MSTSTTASRRHPIIDNTIRQTPPPPLICAQINHNCAVFTPTDEKVKHDPVAFRDSLLRGFADAGEDLEALSKYLDTAGNKLDYKHYGETLFDVLIAGGILGESL